MKKAVAVSMAVLLAAGSLLVGCGGGTETVSSQPALTDQEEAPEQEAGDEERDDSAETKAGGDETGTEDLSGLDIMDPEVFDTPIPILKDEVLKDMGDDFIIGTEATGPDFSDQRLMELIETHFNALTLGNELKPDCLFGYSNNRCPGTEEVTLNGEKILVPVLDFSKPEKQLDRILKYNAENPDSPIRMRGHVLVWHSQTPKWFFHENYDGTQPYVTPQEMNKREEWYIKSVLEHFTGEGSKYADLFYGWDVVNEAVSDGTGTYRNADEQSTWWAVYGSNEFIINAFRYAAKYAPEDLKLFYNDYNECEPKKIQGIVQLINDVKAAEGTRIDGMGMQGHYNAKDFMGDSFKFAARRYGEVVDEVMITELDFKSSGAYDGTKDTLYEEYIKQSFRYRDLYNSIKEVKDEGVNISGIVFWGAVDKTSWLHAFTGVGGGVTDGSPQCPLPFNDDYLPKPAFYAFADQDKLDTLVEIHKQNK